MANLSWVSNQTNISPQDLWKIVTYDLREIIDLLRVSFWAGDTITAFDRNWTAPDHVWNPAPGKQEQPLLSVKSERRITDGQCYSIKINKARMHRQIKDVILRW